MLLVKPHIPSQHELSARISTVAALAAIGGPQFWRLEWIPLDRRDRLMRFNPDAIVLGSSELSSLIDKYKSKINVAVMADFTSQGAPSFNSDDYQVGVIAARHLLQCGLRSMAFFGPQTFGFSVARYQGFRETVAEAGFDCQQWWYSGTYSGPDALDGTPEIYDWLRSLRVVGRSVMQEVRRVHVEQACRLIDTTNLPMPEIARRSGFTHYRRMGIAFKKELGQTPSAYRRQSRAKSR